MKLAIVKERAADEARVAATPETVKRFAGLGLEVVVERGAGAGSFMADDAYEAAGAKLVDSAQEALDGAAVVLRVVAPSDDELARIGRGALLIGMLSPYDDKARVAQYASAGIDAFAMELMPRISRAQSMDVLSSQSNLAGYKAVIDAAAHYGQAFPMMMTAAGTVAPARVFVLGAGVAGLQAIATARRLGAIVSATDVRPVVKEQVESLGATFVMVESEETADAQTAGGYAREMSDDYKRRQAELVAEHLKKQDIVITTALIPGRPAPVLITEEMVASMKPGSVIVDMAVERGGNCPLARPNEIVDHNGVSIMGMLNLPAKLAGNASSLYAKNLLNFVTPFVDKDSGKVEMNWADELVTGTGLTHEGKVVHPAFTDTPAQEGDK